MSKLPSLFLVLVVLVIGPNASGCGPVDRGQDIQFAELTYDQNYFLCVVEPKLIGKKCGAGDPSQGDSGGCHQEVTTFRFIDHEPLDCGKSAVPPVGQVTRESQDNYGQAAREMSPDPDRANLLQRPLKKERHPRQVFDDKSPEAEVIRKWATEYTSQ